MKTYRVFGITLVTGTDAELGKLEQLAAGTHFLTAYGDKRGGPRVKKAEINWPEPKEEEVSETSQQAAALGSVNGQEAPHVSD